MWFGGRVVRRWLNGLFLPKDDGGGGDSWTNGAMSCKALVKSSPPTNQHPVFYRPDALPVNQPKHWREKYHIPWLAYPKLSWGSSNLSLTTNSYGCLGGGLPCLSPALWCQYPKFHSDNVDKIFVLSWSFSLLSVLLFCSTASITLHRSTVVLF